MASPPSELSTVVPLRQGMEPTLDIEREMVDYCRDRILAYTKAYGTPPSAIAFVLVGDNHADATSEAYSWTPGDEERSRLHCCATAAALLMKRALGL